MILSIINIILLVFNIVCSEDNITSYIHKGYEAKLEDFPSIVQVRSMGHQMCAGTLISPKHVLTAAHCVPLDRKENFNNFVIAYGSLRSYNVSESELIEHTVKYACVHRRYFLRPPTRIKSEKVLHDIAVLELETPVKISKICQTIEFAKKKSRQGTRCNMTGWGHEADDSPVLKYREFTIGFSIECMKWVFYVPKIHICAVDREKMGSSAIQGDSGGPLYCKGKVEGVISTGKVSHPTVLTSVPYHRKWIEYFMKTGERKYCSIAVRHNLSTFVKVFVVVSIIFQYYKFSIHQKLINIG